MFQHWSAIFRESMDLCSFSFSRRPEDETPVPKHVGVDTMNFILLYSIWWIGC